MFIISNERDRNFMLFMFCTTIQISLNCYGSLIIPAETMPCLPCAREGRSECARLLPGMDSGNMEINEILRCICMNGKWKEVCGKLLEACAW